MHFSVVRAGVRRVFGRVGVFGPRGGMRTFTGMGRLANDPPFANELIGSHSTGNVTGGADWICAAPEHWVYAGTGMKKGDAVPGLIGGESHVDPAKIRRLEIKAGGPTHSATRQVHGAQDHANTYPGTTGHVGFNAATGPRDEG